MGRQGGAGVAWNVGVGVCDIVDDNIGCLAIWEVILVIEIVVVE